MKYIGYIFARGGSKGLKNKNLLNFDGKPLIAHTICRAKESGLFQDIIVSTDSEEIAKVSRQYGANTPFIRPIDLAADDSSEWLSWKHVVDTYNSDNEFFISLPCTSPLRDYDEVSKMIELYNTKKYDLVLGICKSNHSPDFNMVYQNTNGVLGIINNENNKIQRRQDSKECFNITTYAYITSTQYIKKSKHIFNGKIGGYQVPKDQSIDIDDKHDFEYALYLHNQGKING